MLLQEEYLPDLQEAQYTDVNRQQVPKHVNVAHSVEAQFYLEIALRAQALAQLGGL